MAMKAILFLFTYSVLVAIRGSSAEEGRILNVVYPPKHSPECAPIPPSVKAPSYPPTPIAYPPVKAPVYPPAVAPKGCSHKCVKYCDGKGKQRRYCQRVCSVCCKSKCQQAEYLPCSNWGKITYHGEYVSCP